MRIETLRDQVRSVAKRWRVQYPDSTDQAGEHDKHTKIYHNLAALNKETATPEDVENIIGNASWVLKHQCNECNQYTWEAIELGEEPDYESSTATICITCLRKAIQLIEKEYDM